MVALKQMQQYVYIYISHGADPVEFATLRVKIMEFINMMDASAGNGAKLHMVDNKDKKVLFKTEDAEVDSSSEE